MLGGTQSIGATMRVKVESVGKTGSVAIDKTNTIPPGTRYEMLSNLYKRTGLWSVVRSTWMPREGTG